MKTNVLANSRIDYLTPLDIEAVIKFDQGLYVTVMSTKDAPGSGAGDKPGGGILPDLGHLAHALDVEGLLRDHVAVTVQSPHNRFPLISNKHKTFG